MTTGFRILALALALLTPTVSAFAQEQAAPEPAEPESAEIAREPRYRWDHGVDLSITVATTALGVTSTFFGHEIGGPTVRSVDDVFILDRGVARRHTTHAAARTTSDVVLISSVALAGVATWFTLHEPRGHDRRERFRRIGIFVEAVMTANAMNTVVKLAARRPRPFTYDPAYDPTTGRLDDQLSYYSGHTSAVAASVASAAYFGLSRTRHRALGYSILGVGGVATASVAFLRVRAGRHFPTDVMTGALVGSAIGILVPHLHARTNLSASVARVEGGGVLLISGFLGAPPS